MPLTYKLTKTILEKHGFVLDHYTGSHGIWKLGETIIVVPKKKEFATGTGNSIIKRIATLTNTTKKDLLKQYNIKL